MASVPNPHVWLLMVLNLKREIDPGLERPPGPVQHPTLMGVGPWPDSCN
jgi:hypothetical protein